MWLIAALLVVPGALALDCGPRPCLPGLDGLGLGFDAVQGSSFGVGRKIVSFNFSLGNTYTDSFGNRTVYSVPDEADVATGSKQFMGHSVARSVSDFVATQASWAGVDAHFGPWFSASTETKEVASQMGDSMHIVIESRSKVTLYAATLDPPWQLTTAPKFQQAIDALPAIYDAAAYGQIVKYYGTHYVAVAEFGGLSRMRTIATHSYYSTTSDSELQAQASVQWGLFGGGGGGGSSHNDTSQAWKDSTSSSTYTQGGDPAIRSFNSDEEWTRWAKSVETSAPVQTQYRLEELASMVRDSGKAANLRRAVMEYAAANNKTWPGADPISYQMGWCNCQTHTLPPIPTDQGDRFVSCGGAGDSYYVDYHCPEGYVVTRFQGMIGGGNEVDTCYQHGGQGVGVECCLPCFKK